MDNANLHGRAAVFIRQLALAVTLAVLLTGVPLTADARQGYSETAYNDSTAILQGLGLWNDALAQLQPDDGVSRQQFARLVQTLYGDTTAYPDAAFADMPTEEPYRSAMAFAAAMGLIAGENDRCAPEEPITLEQAAKIAVCMLGRGAVAEANGGYPAGYLAVAQACKLTDGMAAAAQDGLVWANAVILLTNALHTETLVQQPVFGDGFALEPSDVFLTKQHDIYLKRGILQRAGEVSMELEPTVQSDTVVVDGQRMRAVDADKYRSWVGFQMECWYRQTTGGAEELLYLRPSVRQNTVVTLDAEELVRAEDGKLVYAKKEQAKQSHLSIDFNAAVLYNGRLLAKPDTISWLPESGSVTAIDNDCDGSYDVLQALAYQGSYVTETLSSMSHCVIDVFGRQLSLQPEGACEIVRIELAGQEIAFADLEPGDVITTAQSADGAYLTAYVSREPLSAEIAEISGDKIGIGGMEYALSADYRAHLGATWAPSLTSGDSGSFYIDAGGRIAAAHLAKDNMQYGYVIACAASGGLEQNCRVKLLTEQGGIQELTILQTASINHVKRPELIAGLKDSADFKGSVIRFYANEGGEITRLLTADATPDFTCQERGATRFYRNGGRCFDGKYSMGLHTCIMYVTGRPEDGDDGYYVSSKINIGDLSYPVDIYDTDEWGIMGLVVVDISRYDGKIMNSALRPAMVKKLTAIVKPDGEPSYRMTVLYQGKEFSYILQNREVADQARDWNAPAAGNSPRGIVPGDIIQFRCHDKTGEVVSIERRYSRRDQRLWCNAAVSDQAYNGTRRYTAGKLKSLREGVAVLEFPDGAAENYYVTGKSFARYDAAEREPVDVADLAAMYDCLNRDDWEVVIYMHYSVVYDVFLYHTGEVQSE